MGLIREPLDVDFYVDPRPLTKEEQKIFKRIHRDKFQEIESSKEGTGDIPLDLVEEIISAIIDPLDDYDVNEDQRLCSQVTDDIRSEVKQILMKWREG